MENYRIEELKAMSLKELRDEARELLGSAANERIWMNGSDDEESQLMHYNNREAILEEYRFVETLIETKELTNEQ